PRSMMAPGPRTCSPTPSKSAILSIAIGSAETTPTRLPDKVNSILEGRYMTDYRTLAMLVHGESKVGKTTLAATAPMPLLALDADAGWQCISGTKYLNTGVPNPRVDWVSKGPPPDYDGTWYSYVVNVQKWKTVLDVYRWMTPAPLPFVSLADASTTE